MITRNIWPVILVWRDKTIDAKGANRLVSPLVYIRKGRTLTIKNIGEGRFEFAMVRSKLEGSVRIAKKPKEVSVADLKKLASEKVENTNQPETKA